MNKINEIDPQSPPIPPRRKKRKNNLSAIVNSEPALKPSSKPRRKPRLPPPPPPLPPPPIQKAHEKRSQFVKNPQHVKMESADVENKLSPETKTKNSPLVPYEVKFNVGVENKDTEVLQNHFQNPFQNQNHFQNRNACTYHPQTRETNKYPPLLFTFQDFQTVMAESISNKDYQTSLEETFSSNNLIDESKVCFRVTTTNLPFEKCLETWQNSFDNPEFESCEENLFIFEDYIDRSKRTNARPDLFRMESLENSFEEAVPNRTKVRFIIESPSTSTPDENEEVTIDSLQNIESLNKDLEELQKIQSICEAIQSSEEECESGKVPFDSLLHNGNDLNLVEVISKVDMICGEHVQIDEKEEEEEKEDEEKEDEEEEEDGTNISKDSPKITERSSFPNEIISFNNEATFINEITSNGRNFPKEETKIPVSLPELQRYKTFLSDGHFPILDILEVENPKEELSEERKEAPANFRKLQRFKSQKDGSDSYEDAYDSEELILIADNNSKTSNENKIMNLEKQNLFNENIVKGQEIESIQESCEKRKIFIDSSLCDLINDDSESKWNGSSDEEIKTDFLSKLCFENCAKHNISAGTNPLNLKSSLKAEDNVKSRNLEQNSGVNLETKLDEKIDPNRSPQVSSVPVSVRRNSFLDKMLNEETSCEVIATHPKPDESKPEKGMLPTFLKLETTKQEFPTLSTSSDKKVVKRSSRFDESRNEDQKGKILENIKKEKKKSVGEAKSDVLNELLCNFSAIKLKSVTSNKKVDRDPSANHINLMDKSACEQKTDELRVKEDGNASARVTDPSETLASIEDRLASVNKCAIARRSPRTRNNSIDNNAKTPVALSIDQSHDAFSITPGSVRNFVKHYEIQHETSNQCYKEKDKDSKDKETDSKDRDKKTIKKLSVKNKPEILDLKQEVDQNSLIDLKNLEDYDMIGRSKSLESLMNSKQEFYSACQSLTSYGPGGRRQTCIKSNDSSPISEHKKSVQFDSSCTVFQLQKQNESSMSSLINGIRSRIKGKATNKPEMQMPVTFKTSLRSDDSTPEVQKESEVQSTGNTSKSGTDHLVPKTENPHHNQTFVFYCKV